MGHCSSRDERRYRREQEEETQRWMREIDEVINQGMILADRMTQELFAKNQKLAADDAKPTSVQ